MSGTRSLSNCWVHIVCHFDNFLRSICVCFEDPFNGCVFVLALATVEVPRVANHQFEVVVVFNGRAHVLVVVLELLNRHNVVLLVRFPDTHELAQNLSLRLLAALKVGMETDVVGLLNVSQSYLPASVLVKHRVRLVNQTLSACVQVTLHCAQQFVKGKLAVLVGVEVLHDLSHLQFAQV